MICIPFNLHFLWFLIWMVCDPCDLSFLWIVFSSISNPHDMQRIQKGVCKKEWCKEEQYYCSLYTFVALNVLTRMYWSLVVLPCCWLLWTLSFEEHSFMLCYCLIIKMWVNVMKGSEMTPNTFLSLNLEKEVVGSIYANRQVFLLCYCAYLFLCMQTSYTVDKLVKFTKIHEWLEAVHRKQGQYTHQHSRECNMGSAMTCGHWFLSQIQSLSTSALHLEICLYTADSPAENHRNICIRKLPWPDFYKKKTHTILSQTEDSIHFNKCKSWDWCNRSYTLVTQD